MLSETPRLPSLSVVPVARNAACADGYSIGEVLHHTLRRLRFRVGGASSSLTRLERALNQADELRHVRLNAMAGCCVVVFEGQAAVDPRHWLAQLPHALPELERLAERSAATAPAEVGPGAAEEDEDENFVPTRVILPVSSLVLSLVAGPLSLPPLAVAAFILVSSHLTFRRAWQGIREERKVNVDFLDAMAVTLHSLEGFLVGPAMMITMSEGGEAVRDATQRTARSANTDLLASLQTDVRLLVDGTEVIVPSSSLQPGDRIALFPGDQIPVDGRIERGEGSLDVVKLTGESVPRHAGPGDEVLAGFLLLDGNLIIETLAVGEATRVGQISSMIQSAPVFDTRVGNVAARFANRFVTPILALAGLSLVLSGGNIAQAASLLMFDLASGLRVSVPTAIMAALTRAGSQGLLIRSGRSLEQLVDIDVVVFDKTGTLTQGHPSVMHVEVVAGVHSIEKLVQLAASAEQGLNHPVAEAIVKHAEHLGLSPDECQEWDYRIGRGVAARIKGHSVLVGNAKLLRQEGLEPASPSLDPELETATPVYLAVDAEVVAVIYAADALRPDSQAMVAELHRRGIQAHMLTGDVGSVAHAVARRLGLQPQEVHAEALPDEKALLVQELSQKGYKVAFVGDGINDSAALAYADVSVSFASGSDLARETADIVLTNDKVSDLIVAMDLARETFSLVKQNIGIIGVPNLSALVFGTFLPVNPIAAVLVNNGSSLVAAANALRVLGFRSRALAAAPQPTTSTARQDEDHDPATISVTALSRRLGVTHQSITARRGRSDFGSWIESLDPAGHRWAYCARSRSYHRQDMTAAVV